MTQPAASKIHAGSLAFLGLLCACLAAPPATSAEPLHPWQVPAPRNAKEAYFSNLQDGASIETPGPLAFKVER